MTSIPLPPDTGRPAVYDRILAGLLSLVLFLVPLVPDFRLARPKLLVLELGLCAVLLLGIARRFLTGRFEKKNSLVTLPILLYAFGNFLYFCLSPDAPLASAELQRCLLSLAAYYVAAYLASSGRVLVLAGWLSGSFLAVLYGLLQHTGGIGPLDVPKMERAMSFFGNPIFFAAHLVVTLPLAAGILLAARNRLQRLALTVFIAAGLCALYYTGTRAAYIALAVALAVLAGLNLRSPRARTAAALLLAAAFVIFVFHTRSVWFRQQAHLLIWRDTLAMWAQHPFLGTGPGTFAVYFPRFASDALRQVWPPGQFIVNDAHNEYLQYLSETGIAGFGIFLWLIIAFFVNARRRCAAAGGKERFFLSGAVASASAILAQNFFSVDMRFIVSSVYLFFVMGLVDAKGDGGEYRQIPRGLRLPCIAAVCCAGIILFPKILAPYRAQKAVAAQPDFFSEKVLAPAQTIQELERLAERYPAQASVFEKLGWVYAKEKDFEKAVESLERAAQLAPRNPGPLNNIGNIYFLSGRKDEAIRYWQRSLSVDPRQVDSRLNLATAYYYQGQLKEATDQLKEVLRTDPANEKAVVLLKQMTE